MAVEVEFTDEFASWWDDLSATHQARVAGGVDLLRQFGVALPFPHSSGIAGSRYPHMRELRIQADGRPLRVLYAFNPLRNAILLLGGDKTGDARWYEVNVPLADRLYDQHLKDLLKEGLV